MKRILLPAVILIALTSICAQGLGDGCNPNTQIVKCEEGCSYKCAGDMLIKECTQQYGWCSSGSGCIKCDRITVNTPDNCGTIDCTSYNGWAEGTESCFGTVLMQNYANYRCDENSKTCKPNVENKQKENPSSECCPIEGEYVPNEAGYEGIYEFKDTRINANVYPAHTAKIPGPYTALVDSGGMKARIKLEFKSLSAWGITQDMLGTGVIIPILTTTKNIRIEAVKANGAIIQTIAYTITEQLLQSAPLIKEYLVDLPSGTRGIKTINMWCYSGYCFDFTTTIALKCTCDTASWGFDNDFDGYWSYKINGLTECTNPAGIAGFCENNFPSDIIECKKREKWTINPADNKNECKAGDNYVSNTGCKNADSEARDTPETRYCTDADNDGYGINCRKKKELINYDTTGKNAVYNLLGEGDCDDTISTVKNGKIWLLDNDNDGYWSQSTWQCIGPGDKWTESQTEPTADKYDCNDNSNGVTNPEGCNCRTEGTTITKGNDKYVCYSETPSSFTLTPASFEIIKENTGKKWVSAGTDSGCPPNTCLLENRACVKPDTYYSDDGIAGKGNKYCAIDETGAYWSKRTTKIANFLIRVGERTKKDFTVYCDKFNNIAQTYEVSEKAREQNPSSIKNNLKLFMTLSNAPDDVGEGCVLIINDEYTGKIKTNNVMEKQKLIIGLPVLKETSPRNTYFGIELGAEEADKWRKNTAGKAYLYTPLNLLFIVEAEAESTVYNLLSTNINAEITPNSIPTSIFEMITNPFGKIREILTEVGTTEEKIKQADKIYLGKNNAFYFYTLMKENEITARMVNIPDDADKRNFVKNICEKGYEGNVFECKTNTDRYADFDSVLMHSTIKGNADKIWEKFSRQIRLMENTARAQESVYEDECTDENDCEDKQCYTKSCAESDTLIRIKTCEYTQITALTPTTKDDCCPGENIYFDQDNDCPPAPPNPAKLQLSTEITDTCQTGWTELFRISDTTNAHVMKNTGKKVCVKAQEGTLTKTTDDSCNNPIIRFSQEDNAHAGNSDTYPTKVCLSSDKFSLNCEIGIAREVYTQIISLTEPTNAHAGAPDRYETKLQCKQEERQTSPIPPAVPSS